MHVGIILVGGGGLVLFDSQSTLLGNKLKLKVRQSFAEVTADLRKSGMGALACLAQDAWGITFGCSIFQPFTPLVLCYLEGLVFV